MMETQIMPKKNWTKTEPTEPDWYWFWDLYDIERKYKPHIFYWDRIGITRIGGWWAKATPPPFDGEDKE